MTVPTAVRLDRNFDVVRLQRDLERALERFRAIPQAGPYHDGSWRGIALRSPDGDHRAGLGLNLGSCRDTAVLADCGYFREVLRSFTSPIGTARLLFLPSGHVIGEHTDSDMQWEHGLLRLHIPIVTHAGVELRIGGESFCWREGELWYGDFTRIHSVHNQSPVTRVHLVLDCGIDESLLGLFPEAALEEIRASHEIRISPPTIALEPSELERFAGSVVIPPGLLPFQPFPAQARIHPADGRLRLQIFGAPDVIDFAPVGPGRFSHLSHELTFEGGEGAARPSRVRLSIPQIYTTTRERDFSRKHVTMRLREKPSLAGRVGAVFQAVGIATALKLARQLTRVQQLAHRIAPFLRQRQRPTRS